eukprot:4909222-Amphidinium_carterae.1
MLGCVCVCLLRKFSLEALQVDSPLACHTCWRVAEPVEATLHFGPDPMTEETCFRMASGVGTASTHALLISFSACMARA